MSPDQIKLIRTFFRNADPQVPRVVALMYQNFFALAPEAAPLFHGDMETHHQRFAVMLRRTIELLRSSHLWPVLAQTGQAAIPGLEGLRCRHAQIGVTPEHFDKMKLALMQALETVFPAEFTPGMRYAFGQVFDVLAHSMTGAGSSSGEDQEALLSRFLNREIPASPPPEAEVRADPAAA
jgi:hemoglobin-like flavoprotein